jgi:hypothetical protein
MLMAEFATCVKYKRPDKFVVENNAKMDEMQRFVGIDVARMALVVVHRARLQNAVRGLPFLLNPPCQASDYHNELGGLNRLGKVHLIAR